MIFIIGGFCSGQEEYAAEHYPDKEQVKSVHLMIQKWMHDGENPYQEIEDYCKKDIVIIGDEIGCGLIPLEREQREYREMVGRVYEHIAKQAQHVIRTICGIGVLLK